MANGLLSDFYCGFFLANGRMVISKGRMIAEMDTDKVHREMREREARCAA